MIYYYLLFFVPIFSYLVVNKFKFLKALVLFLNLFFLFMLFTFQSNYIGSLTDFDAYNSLWKYMVSGGIKIRTSSYDTSDYGFRFLMKLFSSLNPNFSLFLAILFLVIVMVWIISFKLVTGSQKNNKSLIFIPLFSMYPFVYDLTQIRYFLAYTLVLLAVSILISKIKYRKYIYVFIVILASTIHNSSILFVLLPILTYIPEKIIRKTIFIFAPILFFLRNKLVHLSILNALLSGKQHYLTLEKQVSLFSSLFISIALIGQVYLLYQASKNSDFKYIDLNLLKKINLVWLIFIPFLFINLDVERLFRPLYLINWFIIFSSFDRRITVRKILSYGFILTIQTVFIFRMSIFLNEIVLNLIHSLLN
ncbi:EpsG family protein [Enterococcus italicus]